MSTVQLREAPPINARATSSRLSDVVAERLRDMILDGPFNPGDPIVVADLGRQLGVSRQPVMEALKRIEADGAIEILPQIGCRIRRPDAGEVEDFFQMFAAMEGEICAFAATRHSEDEAANFEVMLADLLRVLDRPAPRTSGTPSDRRLNRVFHGAIHRMARSPGIARLSSALWDRSDFYIKTAFGAFHISSRVRKAYGTIGDAILARDADLARAAAREHLITSGRAVSARIRANSPEQSK
jgi:DNA-binding GntR family transcriptional regulator